MPRTRLLSAGHPHGSRGNDPAPIRDRFLAPRLRQHRVVLDLQDFVGHPLLEPLIEAPEGELRDCQLLVVELADQFLVGVWLRALAGRERRQQMEDEAALAGVGVPSGSTPTPAGASPASSAARAHTPGWPIAAS